MKKAQISLFIIVVLLLITSILFLSYLKSKSNPNLKIPEEKCVVGGGVWREFSNGCVDSCESQRNGGMVCAQVLIYGCDCFKSNECWNGERCEGI
jgi:hypothetical protein